MSKLSSPTVEIGTADPSVIGSGLNALTYYIRHILTFIFKFTLLINIVCYCVTVSLYFICFKLFICIHGCVGILRSGVWGAFSYLKEDKTLNEVTLYLAMNEKTQNPSGYDFKFNTHYFFLVF